MIVAPLSTENIGISDCNDSSSALISNARPQLLLKKVPERCNSIRLITQLATKADSYLRRVDLECSIMHLSSDTSVFYRLLDS